MSLAYTAAQILNRAKQQNTPAVIIEGIDDIAVYERIADRFLAGKRLKFYIITHIKDYAEGQGREKCDQIIKCIHDLHATGHFTTDPDNLRRILGIIDADVRPFRAVLPTHIDHRPLLGKGLFMLKYYSMETYFVKPKLIRELVGHLTYFPKSRLTTETIGWVENLYFQDTGLEHLYYLSLEALKKACDDTYKDENTISYRVDIISSDGLRTRHMALLASKKANLDAFAASLSLGLGDIKRICKGKWYFPMYVFDICKPIALLNDACKSGQIEKCDSCLGGREHECLYRKRKTSNDYDTLRQFALTSSELEEADFEDIIDALQGLQA